jgi:aminoglycoside/choline kinase family phosphotransferase
MARKRPFAALAPGCLVGVKKPKVAHFDLGAAGPYVVLEDLGDSAKVQSMSGRVFKHNKANLIVLGAQPTRITP